MILKNVLDVLSIKVCKIRIRIGTGHLTVKSETDESVESETRQEIWEKKFKILWELMGLGPNGEKEKVEAALNVSFLQVAPSLHIFLFEPSPQKPFWCAQLISSMILDVLSKCQSSQLAIDCLTPMHNQENFMVDVSSIMQKGTDGLACYVYCTILLNCYIVGYFIICTKPVR